MDSSFAKHNRYAVVLGLGVVLMLLMAFLSLRFVSNVKQGMWDSSITTIVDNTQQASNQIGRHIALEIDHLESHVEYLERYKTSDKERLDSLLKSMSTQGELQYLYVAGEHFPRDCPYDPGGYHKNLTADAIGFAEPHIGKLTGELVIDISVPITMADGARGYLLKILTVEKMEDVFYADFYQGQGYAYMVNLEGDILFRSTDIRRAEGDANLFTMLQEAKEENAAQELEKIRGKLQNDESCWATFTCNDEESVYCFVPIKHTDWYIVSVVPCTAVTAQTNGIIKESMLLAGVMFFGFLWLIGLLIYREKKNIKAIEEANQEEKEMILTAAMETNVVLVKVDLVKDTYKLILNKNSILGNFDYGKCCTFSDIIFAAAKSLRPEDREGFLEKFRSDRLRLTLSAAHRQEQMELCSLLTETPHWYMMEAILIDDTPGAEQVLCTVKLIDEQREQEEQRRQAIQSALTVAENANTAKTSFLNSMSHDIRTPMNAIVGMTAIAAANVADQEKVRECLHKITGASNHLLALINDILDMSRIEAGKMSLAAKAFSLTDLLENMSSMMLPQAKVKNQQLKIICRDIVHTRVVGDQLRLQQVFLNIISNAVKYTPEGGYIQVELKELQGQVGGMSVYSFTCRDNGYGMTQEFQEHLFEPFARSEDAAVKNIQGTGLGMVIARNIVRMMDGDIKVESVYGAGSCFEVTFQLSRQADEVLEELLKESSQLTPEEQLAELQKLDYSRKRILLAEDNEINREIAAEIFAMTKVQLDTVEDGHQAVEQFIMHEPGYYDMIFTDIQMPVMNGHEAVRTIRSLPRPDARLIPIIAMTADAFAEDRLSSQQSGMNDHLAKPIDLGKLREILIKYMS